LAQFHQKFVLLVSIRRHQNASERVKTLALSIPVMNHGPDDGILDLAVVQVHADFIADVEFALWSVRHGSRTSERHSSLPAPDPVSRGYAGN